MKQGYLSQYFQGVVFKRLSSVEINPSSSNQHEINGTIKLKEIFGSDRKDFSGYFFWIGSENEGASANGSVTWYDARANHPTRSEFRLYYSDKEVVTSCDPGDLLVIAKRSDQEVLFLTAPEGSTTENQLLWLFDISSTSYSFSYQIFNKEKSTEMDFVSRFILEEMGIEIHEPETDKIDKILEPYLYRKFPPTKKVAELARETALTYSPVHNPDVTLMTWADYEERLFRRLERYELSERLKEGFYDYQHDESDVDGFISYSLRVQNRRKSRAGLSLEHHLAHIFEQNNIKFSQGQTTENKSKPDFLFPDIETYQNTSQPEAKLTMLGAKSTCKDRWRQVLSEADRITNKHLLTLEPAISEHQTNEMINSKLQLVLPSALHETYTEKQREWLMTLHEFIDMVKAKEIK
ncbi:type II restriction endonuclease [Salibacterium lacus]|uniref:Type II restriction endonuclease n=1 Tax=Salibacterium lacus TaxID=1898109 RepID=A0ABW5T5J2_9BACI